MSVEHEEVGSIPPSRTNIDLSLPERQKRKSTESQLPVEAHTLYSDQSKLAAQMVRAP